MRPVFEPSPSAEPPRRGSSSPAGDRPPQGTDPAPQHNGAPEGTATERQSPSGTPEENGRSTGADDQGTPEEGSGKAPGKRRWWQRIHMRREVRWTITIVALIFIVEYLVLPELASARNDIQLLGRVNIGLLIVALLLEVAALVSYAQLTRTVLQPNAPGRFRILRINMSTLAVSHILPGGTAPGTAVGYRLLTDADVPGSTAGFALATQGLGSAVVLNVIFWVSLLISIPLEGFNPLYGTAAIAGVVLLAFFAGTVLLLTKGRHHSADLLYRVAKRLPLVDPEAVQRIVQQIADRMQELLRDRVMLRRALLWAAANWLLDAASLWVFLYAYGATVFPIDLLVAYGLANILAVIPITPGGLGVVEGVLIPTLVGFGVPRNIAILGVLTYRLVNFWLPIPAGGISYLSLRFHHGGGGGHRSRRGTHGGSDRGLRAGHDVTA